MSVAKRAGVRAPSEFPGAEPYLPARKSIPVLRCTVQECRGCPLYRGATQAVLSDGPATARLVMIGEVPGDAEDKAGHTFVGPAGRLLDEALAAAKIDRDEVYLTNAVKHFKFTLRGKRRLHAKPTRAEITACKPWLASELAIVKPEVVVLLLATAAQALVGPSFRVTQSRGQALVTPLGKVTFATVHPAAVLRAPDDARSEAREDFFADLALVGRYLRRLRRNAKPT
jgi:DNA polymerase